MKKNGEEHGQIYIVSFLNKLMLAYPDNFVFWHTPNGGKRDKATAGTLKMMGLKAGINDLIIVGSQKRIVFVECKDSDGRPSKEQKDFHQTLINFGFDNYIINYGSPREAVHSIIPIIKKHFPEIPHQGISKASESALSFIKD